MISIILNTHNHKETTIKYLPKMLEDCGCPYELFINDNNSTDGLQDWLQTLNANVIILQNENIGSPAGLNQLIKQTSTEYIAKIDPDFIMPKDWAKKAIDILDQDEKIGLVGFYWARGFIHNDLQKGTIEKLNNNIIFVPNKVFGVWVFRRSLIEKVGLFYDQVKYGNWDTEFNERVKRHGFKNVYHQLDSFHMGEDSQEERDIKNDMRAGVQIPILETYKLDEFREFIH